MEIILLIVGALVIGHLIDIKDAIKKAKDGAP